MAGVREISGVTETQVALGNTAVLSISPMVLLGIELRGVNAYRGPAVGSCMGSATIAGSNRGDDWLRR